MTRYSREERRSPYCVKNNGICSGVDWGGLKLQETCGSDGFNYICSSGLQFYLIRNGTRLKLIRSESNWTKDCFIQLDHCHVQPGNNVMAMYRVKLGSKQRH